MQITFCNNTAERTEKDKNKISNKLEKSNQNNDSSVLKVNLNRQILS